MYPRAKRKYEKRSFIKLICNMCGEEFLSSRKDALTCGPKCRQQRKRKSDYPLDWLLNKEHWLYKMYNSSNDLLYVGITHNPENRVRSHANANYDWTDQVNTITWQRYPDKLSASEAERKSIDIEHPLYNVK